jgi:hypothetical protein
MAFGQATRTWVSGVGDDANPGSRTAPCKTWAGVISKTATGGEMDSLDPGGFGAVTITKSITMDGGPGVASILVAGTPAITIANSGTTPIIVTIRNMALNGIGQGTYGIRVTGPVILHVDHCVIFGFVNHGIDFEPTAGQSALFVNDTHIQDCGGDGIYLKPATVSLASIRTTRVDNCAAGVYGDANSVTVAEQSSATGNAGAGFQTAAGAEMSVNNSDASLNGTGISAAGKMSLFRTMVDDNFKAGLAHSGNGAIDSFQNNGVNKLYQPATLGSPTTDIDAR